MPQDVQEIRGTMRTTLNIDPIVLNAAKRLAAARSASVGEIISELAHAGLLAQGQTSLKRKSGFPVFSAPSAAKTASWPLTNLVKSDNL